MCYALDINKISNKKVKSGLRYGLVLIIDPIEKEQKKQTETSDEITSLNFERIQYSGSSAKIHLTTLARFTGNRAGSYAMSVLKKMTGTDRFLELPEYAKNCQTETFEDCHAVRYVAEFKKKCGCLPWGLNTTLSQVRKKFGI